MICAAIVGASGYTGGELLRLLLAHPHVEVTQITSETYAGQYAYFVHPNLRGHTDLRFGRLADLASCDLLFLALPHGHAMDHIEDLAALSGRIVDLSADFRLLRTGWRALSMVCQNCTVSNWSARGTPVARAATHR
jgi:N-acetyl-gamma-glutamyl-phosphate/LysW-gamma-L-alpha-aminoadipyl-6-phosphate reductase